MEKILIVEDDPLAVKIMMECLRDQSYEIDTVDTAYEAFEYIKTDKPDLVLLDLRLPDMEGIDIIRKMNRISPAIDIIVVTGQTSAEVAMEAMQEGARNYLVKPIQKQRLLITVQTVFETIKLKKQLQKTHSDEQISQGFHNFIGRSNVMLDLYKAIENISQSDETVVIYGEQGVGKALTAETIHKLSHRKSAPFIKINALALGSKSLSDLMNTAKNGTVYLNNVANLGEDHQKILLEIMEDNPSFRLICSAPESLIEAVKAGSFREDLYYRINILPLNIAPLRERNADISRIALYFLKKYSAAMLKNFEIYDDISLRILNDYHWPGNVRELENMVKNIVTLNADDQKIVTKPMLPSEILQSTPSPVNENNAEPVSKANNLFNGDEIIAIRDLERMAIEHALEVCGGNVQEAALHLKISPATLYRKKPVN